MKNVPAEYREKLKASNILSRCLKAAKDRFPNAELSFCGFENNWGDCIGSCFITEGTLKLLFYFNVDNNTHAVTESGPL